MRADPEDVARGPVRAEGDSPLTFVVKPSAGLETQLMLKCPLPRLLLGEVPHHLFPLLKLTHAVCQLCSRNQEIHELNVATFHTIS